MIPKIIHQAHCGEPMTKQVRQWVESVGRHHPDWSHIVWDEQMLDEIGIKTAPMKELLHSWAAVTNIVRLHLLFRFGGVWLDTDFEALDSLNLLLFFQQGAMAALQDGGRTCNAFMGSERRGKWVGWQLDHLQDFDMKDAASGVYLATACEENAGLVPQYYVYPWMYDSPPEQRVPHADSILCHHWSGSWTK